MSRVQAFADNVFYKPMYRSRRNRKASLGRRLTAIKNSLCYRRVSAYIGGQILLLRLEHESRHELHEPGTVRLRCDCAECRIALLRVWGRERRMIEGVEQLAT